MTSGRRGRPKGVPNKQSKDQVTAAKRGGMMPLGAMLKGMRYWLKVFDDEDAKDRGAVDAAGDPDVMGRPDFSRMEQALDKALQFAGQAAPYVHARLSAQAHYSGEDADRMAAFRGARERLAALLTAAEQGMPLPMLPEPKIIDAEPIDNAEPLTAAEEALLRGVSGHTGTAH